MTDPEAPGPDPTGSAAREFLQRAAKSVWKNLEEAVTTGFGMQGARIAGEPLVQALKKSDADLAAWTRERNREAEKIRSVPRLRS
jgi:hypothetical protein